MLHIVFAISLLGRVNAAVPNQPSNDDMLPAPQRMDDGQMNQLSTEAIFQGGEIFDEELHAQLHAPGGPSEDNAGGRRRMHCDPMNEDWGCCSPTAPCANGEGDCDTDADCVSGYCRHDVGYNYYGLLNPAFDVCEDPNAPSQRNCDPTNLDWSCCSSTSPCAVGEGDCNTDSDCIGTSICMHEVGEDYGVSSFFDVCGTDCSPANVDWSCCSSTSPCANGHGDCDSDNDCTSGYCSVDVGLTYGVQASFDVCETPCSNLQDGGSHWTPICYAWPTWGNCSGYYRQYCEHTCCLHDFSG